MGVLRFGLSGIFRTLLGKFTGCAPDPCLKNPVEITLVVEAHLEGDFSDTETSGGNQLSCMIDAHPFDKLTQSAANLFFEKPA